MKFKNIILFTLASPQNTEVQIYQNIYKDLCEVNYKLFVKDTKRRTKVRYFIFFIGKVSIVKM